MDAVLTVPADFIPDLRSGLFGEWGFAAEDLSTMALQFGADAPGGVFREPLELFDASRTLLDVIGWRRERSQAAVCIDLSAHHLYPTIVAKALTNEREALLDRLDETPRRANEYVRQGLRRRIAVLGDLVAAVEDKADDLKPSAPMATRPLLHSRVHRQC